MTIRTAIAFGLSWGLCVNSAIAQDSDECPTEVQVWGQIVDRDRSYALDLSATALTTTVKVGHKVDVDDFEDRCINNVHIQMSAHSNLGSGCTLELLFGADGGQQLQLREAVFGADSHCPGWPDALEGEYLWSQRTARESVLLGVEPFVVPDRESYESCANLDMASHEFTLAEGRTKLTLEGLSISGTFLSQGSTKGVCPIQPRPETQLEPEPDTLNSGWAVYAGPVFAWESGGFGDSNLIDVPLQIVAEFPLSRRFPHSPRRVLGSLSYNHSFCDCHGWGGLAATLHLLHQPKQENHFELALSYWYLVDHESTQILPHIGYRYQKPEGGVLLRAGFYLWMPSLSVGWAF